MKLKCLNNAAGFFSAGEVYDAEALEDGRVSIIDDYRMSLPLSKNLTFEWHDMYGDVRVVWFSVVDEGE